MVIALCIVGEWLLVVVSILVVTTIIKRKYKSDNVL